MSEAELKRNKKRRQANINVLCGLITKAKDIITAEDDNIEKDKETTASTECYLKKENGNIKFERRNNKCYRRRFHRTRDR